MKLSNLATVLRAAGLTVVETDGWATRGYAGQDLTETAGVLWHHTATPSARYAADSAPTLGMCIGGRPDLAGPLCHIVLGRNGVAYLVAAGVANHAGKGSAVGIPADLGNHYLIGIEMESSGVEPWDWTAAQLAAAPRLGAALERSYLNHLPPEMRLQLGHLEYSSQGKIDPAGWPGGMDGLRVAINDALNTEGDDTMSAADVKDVKDWTLNLANKVLNQVWGTAEVTQRQNIQTGAKLDALISALHAHEAGEAIDLDGIEAAAERGATAALEAGIVKVTIVGADVEDEVAPVE